MKNSITVSVCMVTYNQEAYIEDAIKGVLMQKDCDYELIIADDCSTDGTLAICKNYQEQHPDIIHIIEQSQNKGVVGNTKDCLMACSGKYIAICEGDDYWIDDHKLQKQVAVLDEHQDVSMVHTSWINIFQDENWSKPQSIIDGQYVCERQKGKDCIIEILKGEYRSIRFSSICFRKHTLEEAMLTDKELFSNHYSTCDIVLFYVLAYYGRFYFIEDETVSYRIQRESVSISSDETKIARFSLGCLYIKVHFIKSYAIPVTIVKKQLRASFHSLLKYVHVHKDKKTLFELLKLAKQCGYRPSVRQILRIILCLIHP